MPKRQREVSGHNFTACGKIHLELREASGHDFSRAVNALKISRALAPEGSFPEGGWGFIPGIKPSIRFLEISPRGEAALKSCLQIVPIKKMASIQPLFCPGSIE
jgi:hypothetical protein